ncbi:MAG TPA: cellulose binding domain-containing protein [Actinocrinis sp.]|nr:cellulose binding domain-containing protein [Actinocrinis sp.]
MGTHAAPAPAPARGRRRTRLAALCVGATLLAVGTGFALAGGANAATPAVAYTVTSSWDGGYVGQYTIANHTSAAISGWTVVFTLPSGSSVSSLWNGIETAGGQKYTVRAADWDATIAAGGSVGFGFQVDGSGQPAGCTIDGAPCSAAGSTGPATPSPVKTSAPASPSPSATKTTAGASPPAPVAQTSTPPSGSGSGSGTGAFGKFAPYADLSLYPLYALSSNANTEGTKFFNLAFVTAGGSCTPMWGGVTALTDPSIGSDISSLRGAGGDVRVSFGGASGIELAQSCGSAPALAAAYQKVISAYSLKDVDFDVEGAAVADTASVNLRNQAIATLEANNPGLKVSYTLPVLPTGLTAQGVAVLSSAKAAGVSLDAVDIMAMDYGSSFTGDMAALAEQAATATAGQIQSVWTPLSSAQAFAKVAVTPMIGVNDVSTETFTVADASALASWAKTKGLAWLSFWSATRDSQCSGGAQSFASATCSSVAQSAGAFGRAMGAY